MLVKCINSFRNQIRVESIYLVLEVLIKRTNNMISYRIIDEDGYPAIYDADNFIIVSNNMNHFSIFLNNKMLILSHTLILNSELNKKHIEGFWGLFIEDDTEARTLLQKVIDNLALEENISSAILN